MSPRDLTDRYLKSLTPPAEGRIEISDARRPGLRLRLYASGKANWMYEKRVKGGKKRKHTFGAWPEPVSLSDARAMALEIEAEAARGIDRVVDAQMRKLQKEAAICREITVRSVIDAYNDLHLRNLKRGNERLRQLEQSLAFVLSHPISLLAKKDLQAAIDEKLANGRTIYANRIRAALTAFTRWAYERGYIDSDVGAALPKATKEIARDRVPSLDEVRAIWAASYDVGNTWGPFLRLLILTAQRRSEILGLEWSEIDLDKRRIVKPGSKTKNGRPHITHLSAPAIADLRAMHERAVGDDGLLFTTTGYSPISGVSKFKKRLDAMLGNDVEPWRFHDLRTAFSTTMAESGVPESVADRILNHSASGSAPSAVARVYNKAEMLPQRAAALDRWAEIITDQASNVVQIHGS